MRMGQNVHKFGENRSHGSKVIQILLKFKNSKWRRRPSWISKFDFFGTALLLNVSRGLSMWSLTALRSAI